MIFHNLQLHVPDGSFTVLVGQSGCGSSTLLRMIAGLEAPNAGTIQIGGRDVTLGEPSDHGISMVFQTYAFFPHMTVAQNIDFGLRLQKTPKDERERRVAEAAQILALEPYLERKPAAISGGQRQRVAIGRSTVRNPEVFLFDEPLSKLDAALRNQMRVELADLHRRMNATMIYVTHDQLKAMKLADQIVVLNNGRIEQVGTPTELYETPQTSFVASFIGSPTMNLLEGAVAEDNGAAVYGIRPEHLTLTDDGPWQGRATMCECLGNETVLHAKTDVGTLILRRRGNLRVRHGENLKIASDPAFIHLFDTNGQRQTL